MLQVVDHHMADEVRGVHNLSGGERFLVSLALALGLASMASSRGVKVESLFIDEGFGALDSTSLAMAVSVLEQLQATGRRVGVISHVDELKERIAVKVEVTPSGGRPQHREGRHRLIWRLSSDSHPAATCCQPPLITCRCMRCKTLAHTCPAGGIHSLKLREAWTKIDFRRPASWRQCARCAASGASIVSDQPLMKEWCDVGT